MNTTLDLAVLESRWWQEGNHSVRGVFDMLASIHADTPYGYYYEMFSKESIVEILQRVAKRSDIHHVYVGAHGDDTSIYGPSNTRISRTVLKNAIRDVGPRRLYGLFFGCCRFGKTVDELASMGTNLTWIAGYKEEVEWVHSTAMDLYFWNAYLLSSVSEETRRDRRAEKMLWLLFALWHRVPYLFVELGFRVALAPRAGGKGLRTFPDDFLDDNAEPIDRNTAIVCEAVLEHIVDNDPGTWP